MADCHETRYHELMQGHKLRLAANVAARTPGRCLLACLICRAATACATARCTLEYKGTNKTTVAARYGITDRRVEQIAAEQRIIYVRKLQGRLFIY